MNSHLNHLVAQERHAELARAAERQRLTHSALAATRLGVRRDSATKRLFFKRGIKLGGPPRSRADSVS